MKKLSLVVALILCVTIGGVYASWIYTGTQADTLHHHITNLALSDLDTTTKYGKYEVVAGDDTIKIKFDQKNQTVGQFDYTAVLSFTGQMKVTFTPDVAFEGVPTAKFRLAYENTDLMNIKFNDKLYGSQDGKVGEQAIFKTFDTTTETLLTFSKNDLTGNYEATINAADLVGLIEINNIVLDTNAGYNAFAQALSTVGRIAIEVVDYTVPNIATAGI